MSLKNLSATIKIHKIYKQKLRNKKINQIYKKFERSLDIKKDFVVAVSGGPDSLALSFLAKIFSLKKKLNSKFFIIDHKLRPESTFEAKRVVKVLRKFFIKAEILTWKGQKPSNNIQSLAREKRYKLLVDKCNKLKINNILLGHHEDDLYENFFIRLLRGSGLKGLVSLDKKTKIGNINLLRPLLSQKKKDLIFLAKSVFNFYVKDPSNEDQKYQRIKIRKLIQEFQKDGLDKKKLIKTINNLKFSNNVINFYVEENLKKNTFFSNSKNSIILNKTFFQQPYEIIFRSLTESLKIIGKKYYPVRGKKLSNAIDILKNRSSFKLTLGNCIIEKVNETVIITKEL